MLYFVVATYVAISYNVSKDYKYVYLGKKFYCKICTKHETVATITQYR